MWHCVPAPEAVTIDRGTESAHFLGTDRMFHSWRWAGSQRKPDARGAEEMLMARTAGVHCREDKRKK